MARLEMLPQPKWSVHSLRELCIPMPQAQKVKYVFNHIMYDANYVVQGLWKFVEHYLQTHPAAAKRARLNGFTVCADY